MAMYYFGHKEQKTKNQRSHQGEQSVKIILFFPLLLLLPACGKEPMKPEEPTWVPRSTPYNIVSTRISASTFLRVEIDPRDFESGRNFVLSGTFEVTSGGSRDINAYVVDEIGYINFRNNNNFRALFSANRVTTDRFSVSLRSDEAYYFILSNRFSLLTSKTVDAKLELRYEEQLPTDFSL